MKAKNTAMLVLAVLVGVGGSFAKGMFPQNVWVRARLAPGAPVQCVNTFEQCDPTGNFLCTVIVNTQFGAKTIRCDGFNQPPYYSGCVTAFCNDTWITYKYSSISVWDLADGLE